MFFCLLSIFSNKLSHLWTSYLKLKNEINFVCLLIDRLLSDLFSEWVGWYISQVWWNSFWKGKSLPLHMKINRNALSHHIREKGSWSTAGGLTRPEENEDNSVISRLHLAPCAHEAKKEKKNLVISSRIDSKFSKNIFKTFY